MSLHEVPLESSESTPGPRASRRGKRLIGIDAARGLALIGLMAIHILPESRDNGDPTLTWTLFSGDSAALFALLAGVGLALSTGGTTPHVGRRLAADRVGLAVRAVVIGAVALLIAAIMPEDPPAYGILLYYSVFFLLAIPVLRLGARALFTGAGVLALVSPVLMQQLDPVLPETSTYNHTLVSLFTEPVGTASELLLSGSYPALTFMVFLLVGLGLGRLDLRNTRLQVMIAGIGAGLALLANALSWVLLHGAGGYQALMYSEDLGSSELDEVLIYGPDVLPDSSGWWLAIATPHSGTTLAIASSLGIGMLVLGVFLLVADRAGRWLAPLAAMGSMTLTLYSAHLVALAPELHYDEPNLWFVLHLGAALAFAWIWHRARGKGPLESVVAQAAQKAQQIVENKQFVEKEPAGTTTGGPVAGTPTTWNFTNPHSPTSGPNDRPGAGTHHQDHDRR